jgi:hypothetical protein
VEVTMRGPVARYAVAAIAVAVLVGCQSLTEEEQAAPTGPSKVASVSAITIPVIGLSSAPSPTPTPTPEAPAPTATPTPEPTPTPPPPASSSCQLPPSNPSNPVCSEATPQLLGVVEEALDTVTERFPELFDFNNTRCGNCYYVKNPHRYITEVIEELGRRGVCTDGVYEELGMKSSNDFSEQYDIILSTNHMRRGTNSYRGVCWPAIF